ncbi:hypothetical protein BF96_04175 [Micrococcus luteus]|jgi:cation transport ATPase|nr:hypothetical protein [Micrococcus luteus]AJO56873.1 hypothetical protein BF96_04175 [Micrococcus luteus]
MPVSVVVALILGLHQAGGPRGRRGRPCPRDLSALLDRARQCAHRLRPDGTVEDVPVEEVRPAEVLPVDGAVASAEGGGGVAVDLDESSLTGESCPSCTAPARP